MTVNGSRRYLLNDFDVVIGSGISQWMFARSGTSPRRRMEWSICSSKAVVGPPFLNAIELVPGSPGRTLPIRIRAGDSSVTDHSGNVTEPGQLRYIGGRLATSQGDVSLTQDPDL